LASLPAVAATAASTGFFFLDFRLPMPFAQLPQRALLCLP
jgi:hypothetical protein